MRSIVATRQACAYYHASDLPNNVWGALSQHEAAANLILPFAHKALKFPRASTAQDQLWIVLYDDANNVEFVLSCTKGLHGDYPIFILATQSSLQLAQEEKSGRRLSGTLRPLVLCLLEEVPPQRIFSVFAIAQVTETFADLVEAYAGGGASGIRALAEPYYDATFTFCTRETLKRAPDPMSTIPGCEDVVIALRRADMSHLEEVQAMCKGFSETSWPFVLDDAGAELDARLMIENREAWVHLVQRAGQAPEVACLVATTRESENVTAVTKVFTAAHWRGRGCAARLLHRVCQETLEKKTRVVLYVGNSDELAPARKVYHKIGFQGLGATPQGQQQRAVKDVERWLEIGFEGTVLGHW